MPEIARTQGYRIYMYTDDHPPAHVHVRSGNGVVRIYLAKGTVKLGAVKGQMTKARTRRAGVVVRAKLDLCWRAWRRYHGEA